MPPRPFVNDALWRCLCPGFPTAPSCSAIPRVAPALRRCPPKCSSTQQRRASNQSMAASPYGDDFFSHAKAPSFGSGDIATIPRVRNSDNKIPLVRLSTYLLYEHLRDAGARGKHDEALSICRVLVKDRGEAPNKEMYNAILHSFVSAVNGTAGKVRKVLDEMGFWAEGSSGNGGQAKIDLDARGCECVLEALAVHPDYLLRTEIIEYMKSRWLPLSPRGQNFVVAGMLRERNFEQALDMLEDMIGKQVRVESWLLDEAMWILLEYGEVEEAFHVLSLKDQLQRGVNGTGSAKLSSALWGALLDHGARRQLYESTKTVWTIQVQPGYLKPATGACLSVLAVAARHGDVQLATDVFRVLTERETVFTTHHYELLVETYLNANDLSAALSVLLIMFDTNIRIDAGTCHPLFWYLQKEIPGEPSRPIAALNILQDFETSGRKVPTAAINACIQASIALKRFEEAIEIYKVLHTVSHTGPDTQTFNILFQGCRISRRKEVAMFLANEMIQLGLRPDRMTYDRLIGVCLDCDSLEDALQYYEEMRLTPVKSGSKTMMQPRRRTWEGLMERCVKKNDERAVALLKDYKQHEPLPRPGIEKKIRARFEERQLEDQPADALAALETEKQGLGEGASVEVTAAQSAFNGGQWAAEGAGQR
ncbi:hypothetical protein BDU57DRAFT_457841 [Ampelomyces quisqualis]|uniref:Pentatricopeptide repeat-containing protein-mitochondrial domain-containing protein n=1 Tax=Ampelomyces quisqualis TaxID=50730 RepID=A0A6A5QBU6_AMPQU|nr:hypothetical protein BDU57DRAFT_457841 [Ampelomyces quisqualis]